MFCPDSRGLNEHKHYLRAGGETFALHTQREGNLGGKPPKAVSYFHHDHLGSLAVISNAAGTVVERLAYDPWGKRRQTNGLADSTDTLTSANTKRGYTMHEHMDEMGVINMNGRVYDPAIGRFLTADPFIQAPQDLQSFNRYSYVKNNPLAYTDPSGYFFKKLKKYFRTIVAIVVAVVIVVYLMPMIVGAASASAMSVGAKIAAGALAGGAQSAISAGTGKAFWKGALSGALFAGAGAIGAAYGQTAAYAAHAGAGCISAVAGGGNCGRGMASALVGKFTTLQTEGLGGNDLSGHIMKGAMASVSGGLASVAGGGSFKDGATTAAFGYLFNQWLSKEEAQRRDEERNRAVMRGNCVAGGPMAGCSGVSDFGYSTEQTKVQRQEFRRTSGQVVGDASTGLAMAAPFTGPAAAPVLAVSGIGQAYSTWATPPTSNQIYYDSATAVFPLFYTPSKPIVDTLITFGAAVLKPKN